MNVGFIGLGAMGRGIAGNLLKAGHRLTVWNRSPEAAESLRTQGATVARTAQQSLESDLLISMLASDSAISEVGLDGSLLDHAPKGLLHVNMATVSVECAKAMCDAHRKRGLEYIADTVFGRPDAAAAGRLVVVAAGEASCIERARPLFEKIGQRIAVVGPTPEQANLFKIAGNFMIASAIEAMGEAIALLRKGGVAPDIFIDVLTSTLFSAPVYQTYGKIIVAEAYEPAGFQLRWGFKDAGLALSAAKMYEAPLPLGSTIFDHFLEAVANGSADKDWSYLAGLAARRAGLPIGS